jgi:GTP-binding protein
MSEFCLIDLYFCSVKISSAIYVSSNVKLSECPPADKPEYAFIGRSNVGKSSLINMLTGVTGLARTSSTPGKTQIINHFLINDSWYLVDLPGYGYAKVSKSMRADFDKMISTYLLGRTNLLCVFVLVDSRIKPQELDLNFMMNLAENSVPFCIAFTKCDKMSKTVLAKNIAEYKKVLLESWEEVPPYFLTSAENKTGREELLKYVAETNKLFEEKF